MVKSSHPTTTQITSIIYDSFPKCTPLNPGIGINCNIINIFEKTTPIVAITLNAFLSSLSLLIVILVTAQVKKYPIDAPITDISTNQPSASLPSIGPVNDTIIQNIITFTGVPVFSLTIPNISGKYHYLLIKNISLDNQSKIPLFNHQSISF